jgi:DtxR family Mn-dependent transcriptional regulator
MHSTTVENYLKHVCLLRESTGQELVPMGKLAAAVGVTSGTATTMVKSFPDAGLLRYAPHQGVKLTVAGQKLALRILHRHRLIEQFLVQIVGLDWAEVHEEAELLEHAISDRLLERIDALLGHPEADPHGSPIPRDNTPLPPTCDYPSLNDCTIGKSHIIARLVDHDADFLHFAAQVGLRPGQPVTVQQRDPHADALTCTTGSGKAPSRKHQFTLGSAAAARVLVNP